MPRPLTLAPLLLLLAGCTVDPTAPGALALRDLDFNDFACRVQPVTAARCSMLACHGQADKAFRVYSPGKLRVVAGATLVQRDAPITLAEVRANFDAMRGLAFAADGDPVETSPFVRKPLAKSLGGGSHVGGGELFLTTADPGLLAFAAWLGGEKLPGGCDFLTSLRTSPSP